MAWLRSACHGVTTGLHGDNAKATQRYTKHNSVSATVQRCYSRCSGFLRLLQISFNFRRCAELGSTVQRFNWPGVLREDIAWLQLATDHQGMCLPKAQLHRVISNMRTGSKHVENVLKTWHSALDSSYVLFYMLLSYQFICHFIYHFLISSYFLIFPLLPCLQNYLRTPLFLLAHCKYMWTQKNAGVLPLYGLHSTWFLANAFATWFARMSQSELSRWNLGKMHFSSENEPENVAKTSKNVFAGRCPRHQLGHLGDHAPGPWSVPSASQGSPWQVGEKLSEPNNRSETNRNESFKFRWMVPHGSLRFPKTKKTKKT